MKIEIKDFRGLEKAEIDLTRLALIGGRNASAKSSIAQAVGAALSGQVIPIRGVAKTEAGVLVRSGAAGGEINLSRGADSIRLVYPKAAMTTEGNPPVASPFAVGLRSLADLPDKEKAETLIKYLNALPTEEDLGTAAKAMAIVPPADQVAKLWQFIKDSGWDGAHLRAKETGARFKGQWESTTGERYGSAKAEKWIPANWASDLSGASEESLLAKVTEAKEFLEAAIASNAIGDAEYGRLRALADSIPELEGKNKEAETAFMAADCELSEACSAVSALVPVPTEEKITLCPHCNEPVVVVGTAVRKPSKQSQTAEVQELLAKHDAANAVVKEKRDARATVLAVFTRAQADLHTAQKARDKSAELEGKTGDGAAVEKAREGVREAEGRLTAFQNKTKADKLAISISINQEMVEILAPEGLRQRKLAASIKEFNTALGKTCALADWRPVEIAADLTISYARRPWGLLSESERFRARVVLQIALALRDKSQALVLDAADILDRPGRNGLFKILAAIQLPALVTMTLDAPADLPDLAAAGIGESYWLSEGITTPRAEAIK